MSEKAENLNANRKEVPSRNNTRQILILNVFAVAFYFLVIRLLFPDSDPADNLLSTSDANEYYGYSVWLEGESDYYNSVRTYFFPLLILLIRLGISFKAFWLFQFVLWLITCNLTYASIARIKGAGLYAIAGFLLICTNISFIELTTEALAEVTTTCLLGVLAYTISRHRADLLGMRSMTITLLILATLTATKPVFQPLTYLVFTLFLIRLLFVRSSLKYFIIGIASLLPMLTQAAISYVNGRSAVKVELAESNLKKYLYRKTKYLSENRSLAKFDSLNPKIESAMIDSALQTSNTEAIRFLVTHPVKTIRVVYDNIYDNVASGNPYVRNKILARIYGVEQKLMYIIHLAVLFVMITLIILSARKIINWSTSLTFSLIMEMIFLYLVLTTSLVFWAGDRMVLPAISVWIPGYMVLAGYILGYWRNRQREVV